MTGGSFPMPLRMMLDDPAQAWRIVSGSVDLFLVDRAGAMAQSSLDYLGSLEAGSVLVGMAAMGEDGYVITVVAETTAATMLQPIALDQGASQIEQIDAAHLDAWILRLAEWCAPGLAPATSRQVEAGQAMHTGEDGMTLISGRGVVWVGCAQGMLSLYGADFPPAARRERWRTEALPVCRYLWVAAPSKQEISCRSTEQWLALVRRDSSVAKDWASVSAAMLTQRRQRRLALEARERLRFQEKITRDSLLFAGALRELTAPLAGADALRPRRAVAGMESTLEVCRAVGAVMGVELIAPEDAVAEETVEQAVLRVVSASGVRYRQVLLRGRWWKRDQGPMIGFRLNGVSPVALLASGGRGYEMFDPVAAATVAMTGELSASLDARAYVLYRSFPNRKLNAMDLLLFGLHGGRKDLGMILGAGLLAGLLAMAMPVATGVLFDSIIPEGQRTSLVQLSVLLLSASVAIFLIGLGQSFATQRLEGRMESAMEAAVWDRLLNLRTGFFRKYTTGDLAARSLAINQIRQALTSTATSAVLSGVFSVFSFALLFVYNVKLAAAATALAAVAISFSAGSTLITLRLNRRILAIQGKITGHVAELLQGVAKFRVSGTEPRAFARWASDSTSQKQAMLDAAKVAMATSVFNTVFPLVTVIVLYILAASMARADPRFSTGRFLAFNAAFGQFLGATLGFGGAILSLVGIVPTYERARPILEELPELKANLDKPGALSGRIEVSHVTFRYREDGPCVLDDVSFSIKPGQYVALVGDSGCGKSTLMRLLLGFESPENGAIFYDGKDLAQLDLQAVRRQIGVVLQSGRLMAADIFTNIVGAALLTMTDAWAAAEAAGLAEDIRAMPMGMHTVVNESGSGLSGGQRQRLLIARAVVHRPRILFFDEATSALDNQTQSIVSRSLDAMQATRIVIAHRLSTVRHADLILVFKNARLQESGTFEELLQRNGHFADLAKRQLA